MKYISLILLVALLLFYLWPRDYTPSLTKLSLSIHEYENNTITFGDLTEEAKSLGFPSTRNYMNGILFVIKDCGKFTTGYYYSKDIEDLSSEGSGHETLGGIYKNFVKVRIKKREAVKIKPLPFQERVAGE